MRRTHEEVKAELLRRRDDYHVQQKRRRKAVVSLTASVACAAVLLAVALPHLPLGVLLADAPSEDKGNATATSTAHSESPQYTHATHIYDDPLNGDPDKTQPTDLVEEPVESAEPVVSSTAATQTTTKQSDLIPPDSPVPSRSNVTTTQVCATSADPVITYPSAITRVTTVCFTQAPHGSDRPYRGAVAAFAPAYVRLPYEGNAVQVLTAEATALWEYSVQLTDRPRKTEIGDEMIGARYVVFRDADGYELTCLYCDTCVGLGNNWYDITAEEAAALDALLSALL